MPGNTTKLRWSLSKLGLSDLAIDAAWPAWWSEDAEPSVSAQTELRFSLARKLGLDPRSLLEDEEPRFVWRDKAKFKQLSGESDLERAAIASFGSSISRALVAGVKPGRSIEGVGAGELRESILSVQPYVRLVDLLGLGWAVGIPIIHLRVFPLPAKRMCAMTVAVGDRFAILLGRDADYPAPIAYFLAHELAHIALGHLRGENAVIDLQNPLEELFEADDEERAADAYALELLTGTPAPTVKTETVRFTAKQLADNLLKTAKSVRIEPGTLALCFGHSTGDWAKANAALRSIYTTKKPVWAEVNQYAMTQLDWTATPDDVAFFVRAVMGGIANGDSSC